MVGIRLPDRPPPTTNPRPGIQARKVTVKEADEPGASERTNHTPALPNHRPLPVADTRQNRNGRMMPARTNLAVAGPALATVSMQLASLRTCTVAGHDSAAEMSASRESVVVDTDSAKGPAVASPTLLVAITEYVNDVVPVGGVPERAPVVASTESHDGAPGASEYVGVGTPLAVNAYA